MTKPAVEHVTPDARTAGEPTPGMVREQAIATGVLWSGYVTTEAHMTSGWHHHGDHETSIYIVDGALRMEFGPGGTEVIDAEAGDFLYVAPHRIHREGNPSDGPSHLVVSRSGSGPVTTNVDGPEPG